MLTHAKIKQIRSLHQKKFRVLYQQYLIEGKKIVYEALRTGNQPECILVSEQLLEKQAELETHRGVEIATAKQLSKISNMKNPPEIIAVMSWNEPTMNMSLIRQNLSLGLDCIQDPGNLGTIIRIADWFGINDVLCSKDSVDVTNPKVVQASMGSLFRVRVHYIDLVSIVQKLKNEADNFTVYGAFMDGENVYAKKMKDKALLLLGNEGRGLSSELGSLCDQKIGIPYYSTKRETPDSLNISVAAGVFCSEFRR